MKVTVASDLHSQILCAKRRNIASGQFLPCDEMPLQYTHCEKYPVARWTRRLGSVPLISDPSA